MTSRAVHPYSCSASPVQADDPVVGVGGDGGDAPAGRAGRGEGALAVAQQGAAPVQVDEGARLAASACSPARSTDAGSRRCVSMTQTVPRAWPPSSRITAPA
jgi:hypothetical protein